MLKLSPPVVSPRASGSQSWKDVGEKWPMNFAWNARLLRGIQESFTCCKSTRWDRRLYFPSEGRDAEDFFALKNPTASAGFEPANLGTKCQHATSRPPKPLPHDVNEIWAILGFRQCRMVLSFWVKISVPCSWVKQVIFLNSPAILHCAKSQKSADLTSRCVLKQLINLKNCCQKQLRLRYSNIVI